MKRKIKMALIATYPRMAELFLEITNEMENVIATNVYASFERAVEIAKKWKQKEVLMSF